MQSKLSSELKMKARIKWTLKFDYPFWEGMKTTPEDLERVEFYLEESHCQENLLEYLYNQSEDGICKLCSIGEVELLGIVRDE